MKKRFSLSDKDYLAHTEPREFLAKSLDQLKTYVYYGTITRRGYSPFRGSPFHGMVLAAQAVPVTAAGDIHIHVKWSLKGYFAVDYSP
jgi:hypothetical protein